MTTQQKIEVLSCWIDEIVDSLSTEDMQIASEKSSHTPKLNTIYDARHKALAELDVEYFRLTGKYHS